ncbi:MAG TPA: hypothetical protein VK203_19620 [Nostocaceae cyanobacterium]|nr:hypothetical protein [Nostocaceae cyanobacterium]
MKPKQAFMGWATECPFCNQINVVGCFNATQSPRILNNGVVEIGERTCIHYLCLSHAGIKSVPEMILRKGEREL